VPRAATSLATKATVALKNNNQMAVRFILFLNLSL
jgi:hypothetical protein